MVDIETEMESIWVQHSHIHAFASEQTKIMSFFKDGTTHFLQRNSRGNSQFLRFRQWMRYHFAWSNDITAITRNIDGVTQGKCRKKAVRVSTYC